MPLVASMQQPMSHAATAPKMKITVPLISGAGICAANGKGTVRAESKTQTAAEKTWGTNSDRGREARGRVLWSFPPIAPNNASNLSGKVARWCYESGAGRGNGQHTHRHYAVSPSLPAMVCAFQTPPLTANAPATACCLAAHAVESSHRCVVVGLWSIGRVRGRTLHHVSPVLCFLALSSRVPALSPLAPLSSPEQGRASRSIVRALDWGL